MDEVDHKVENLRYCTHYIYSVAPHRFGYNGVIQGRYFEIYRSGELNILPAKIPAGMGGAFEMWKGGALIGKLLTLRIANFEKLIVTTEVLRII